ncbi:LysR family transcriptional regulator [Vibrio maritimus]|uniref:LysR family transcriptional regulator n=1 Tax=Vibrio maritimus TaxID=990268 RepID=UPI001F411DD7|nr:LysR family transcriptional regulator [Vibrio maritimus]
MDKFDCLSAFFSVARNGTFTAAANDLNTTQSAISKKIAWLERDLGVTLFHRHARAISMTTAGHDYLSKSQKLMDEMAAIESQLRKEQRSVSGVLSLSVPSAFSVKLLSKPLNEFLKRNPELSVNVSVSDRFIDLVEGNVDIAIRATQLKDSGLRVKWFMDNELIYFASPTYLEAREPISSVEDLVRHDCLTYSLSSPSNLWRFNDGNNRFTVKVNEVLTSDSPDMLVQMAKLGLGIAAMPRWMVAEELEAGILRQVLEQYPSAKLPMYLVYKDSEHQPRRVRAFIDYLSEWFEGASSLSK